MLFRSNTSRDLERADELSAVNHDNSVTRAKTEKPVLKAQTTLTIRAANSNLAPEQLMQVTTEEFQTKTKDDSHERRERLNVEVEEQKIDKEIEGTLRLANLENITRSNIIELIDQYIDKRDSAKTPEKRQMYQEEIDNLRRQLRNESGAMAGKANFRQEPEGGTPPPESGSNPQAAPGTSGESDSAEDAWHVN